MSPYLRLSGEYRFDRARFDSRQQEFDAHVVRLRTHVSADSKLSALVQLQLNTAADLASVNVRVRYNMREGNDLWISYGHVLNTTETAGSLAVPITRETALTVKYTYTFNR